MQLRDTLQNAPVNPTLPALPVGIFWAEMPVFAHLFGIRSASRRAVWFTPRQLVSDSPHSAMQSAGVAWIRSRSGTLHLVQ